VVWLAVILGAVFLGRPLFAREGLMAAAAAASYFTTRRSVHAANQFSFHPLAEVAVLFAGIFATMAPAVDWLGRHAAQVGRLSPARCYWSSGMASSLLDNAPTYASFLSATEGRFGPGPGTDAAGPEAEGAALLVGDREASMCLLAISLGAVFFGAMTYIGNGPNLMIKAIADEQGAPSPGFGGFVGRFSVPYLLPVLVVVWVLFLRG
jgi:Na+/H+ antiporter NhaD/arsenite permease-like protein